MKVRELIKYGEEILEKANIPEYKSDVKILITHLLDISYSEYFFALDNEVDEEKKLSFQAMIDKRATHYPCQYITGVQNFMGYDFSVCEGVLVPRPETELLVEEAVKQSSPSNQSVLDMCCGSGCIGISYKLLRKELGYKDNVTLVDLSKDALKIANANNDKLSAGCELINSDLFTEVHGKYNIIISNPPYIETKEIDKLMEEVKCFEPMMALDGLEDGLFFYRKIISEAKSYLEPNGVVLFEIGYNQYESVKILFENEGYRDIKLIKDYAGLDRIVLARYS